MTKRDFFILIFKLFGLQAIGVSLFSVLPSVLTVTFRQFDITVIIWTIVIIGIMAVICWSLLFEADKMVDFLRLDQGFSDDKIELGSIKSADILKIGAFLIGGLMIVSNLPELLSQTFWTFMGANERLDFDSNGKYGLTVRGLNILIGFLLITNLNFVATLLKNKDEV